MISIHPLRLMTAVLCLTSALGVAQNSPEHTFKASRADLDRALASLRATAPGRLPILDGFVSPDVSALEKYQRAYYQYKLEIHPTRSGEIALRVSVKVTAWYAGDKAAAAGYRVLPSNGRLESDLVERLEEALQQKSSDVADALPSSLNSDPPAKTAAAAPPATHAAKSTAFSPGPQLAPPVSRAGLAPPDSQELAGEKHFQQLTEQAANLEEVLRNQARPKDLAVVRNAGTPVFAKPVEPGDVLFRADPEDEFKVLDESGGWIHVQVSGISRGWIRRADLEMPEESPAASEAPTLAASPSTPKTHEETSLFPGEWSALRGRLVRITWLRPGSDATPSADRWQMARAAFRATYDNVTRDNLKVDGIVLVIDAADGGMVAATAATLWRWNTGAISDAAFRKECWTDTPEALGESAHHGTQNQ